LEQSRVIGVDVGGTKILAAVVSRDGSLGSRLERPSDHSSQDALLTDLDSLVEELHRAEPGVQALGFGVPSRIDQRSGRALKSVNIPLEGVDLRDRMRERHGLPVALDNDANAAAIGEWQAGAARGARDVVMLTLGTGVGGGLILGGRPYRGSSGAGAELGHVVVVHDGPPCRGACTGRGHLEAVASGRAAGLAAKEEFGPAADAHRLVRLANEGDETARGILADIGRYLGSGMGSFVNTFAPDLIVIGGGFGVAGWEHLIASAKEVMQRESLLPMRDIVQVARAELGTAAGLIGAGFVGFEALE
jgi:glucokinase